MRPFWASAQAWPAEGDNPFVGVAKFITAMLDLSGRAVAVLCLAFMFAALLVNVVLRYAFGTGIPWAYEIHSVLLPWLVAGGVVAASAHGRQITITLLYDIVGDRHGRWILVLVQVAIVSICSAVLWTSPPILTAANFQRLSTLGITQIWGYSSLIFAFAGMGAIAALDGIRLLTGEPFASQAPARTSLS